GRRARPRLRRHGRRLGRDRPGDRRARRRGRHRRREARRGLGGPRPSDEQDRRARLPAPQGIPWRAAGLRARGRVSQGPVTTDPSGEPVPGPRILLGPGPSTADPRVLSAMAAPLLGQFDPEFTAIMNEVMALCRFAFQTQNQRAFPVSGTGRAGLEAAIVSLVEPGDRVVVGECGRFGLLLIEIAERGGAEVVPVKAEWGRVIEPEAIEAALQGGRTRLVALVHGETSTGVLQPLEDIARLCRRHEALLLADAVVTLGGSEVAVDRWQVDVAVAGTQKCLSCPSGLAPLTYNDRAERVLAARTTRIRSNYLDLAQLARCRAGSGESGRWGIRPRGATSCSASPRSTRCFASKAGGPCPARAWTPPWRTTLPWAPMSYPRDLIGYGAEAPDPKWPGGARLALQLVMNYEEGGERSILHGDDVAEAFLQEVVGMQPLRACAT